MLTIAAVLSDQTPGTVTSPDGVQYPQGYALWIYATDDDGRPWRLIVLLGGMFGFGGLRIERTDVPGYRESDLDDEESSWYPPFVPTDAAEALAQIAPEFERASVARWTRVYVGYWNRLRDSFEILQAILNGERRIGEHSSWTMPGCPRCET